MSRDTRTGYCLAKFSRGRSTRKILVLVRPQAGVLLIEWFFVTMRITSLIFVIFGKVSAYFCHCLRLSFKLHRFHLLRRLDWARGYQRSLFEAYIIDFIADGAFPKYKLQSKFSATTGLVLTSPGLILTSSFITRFLWAAYIFQNKNVLLSSWTYDSILREADSFL